ncbi:hypothetical protein C8R44DRAFT_811336 [Mycena epipterygia]|nr:hypothetical protein C8R44DRAFT_811336 [Mycena epipterygia]
MPDNGWSLNGRSFLQLLLGVVMLAAVIAACYHWVYRRGSRSESLDLEGEGWHAVRRSRPRRRRSSPGSLRSCPRGSSASSGTAPAPRVVLRFRQQHRWRICW